MQWKSLATAVVALSAVAVWAGTARADDSTTFRLGGQIRPAVGNVDADTMTLQLDGDADTELVYRRYGGYYGGYRGFYGGYRGFYGGYRGFYGGYRGLYGGYGGFYRPYYRSLYYPRYYGYYPRSSFSFSFGFGRPYYYPYYGYYPIYSSYSPYSYWAIDGSCDLMPPATTLELRSSPTEVERLHQPTPVPPVPQNSTSNGNGAYRYDGGPQSPVPMPSEDVAPLRTPVRPTVPLEGRPVSLTTGTKTKFAYPAYGEQPKETSFAKDRAIPVKTR